MSTIKLSKKDQQIHDTLTIMKLKVVKAGEINLVNLSSFIIECMRLVEHIKDLIGSEKRATVADILTLLMQQYGSSDLFNDYTTIENMVDALHAANVLMPKKRCC